MNKRRRGRRPGGFLKGLTAAAELRAAYDRGDPPTKKKKSKRKRVAKPKPARPVGVARRGRISARKLCDEGG